MKMKGKRIILMVLAAVFVFNNSFAVEEPHSETSHDNEHAGAKFDPGKFIFDHIKDSYTWHIFSYRSKSGEEKHVGINFPVILYSGNKGLVVFSSGNFHHGHSSYNGFRIADEGEHEGKIIEELPDGTVLVPLDLSITKNVAAIFFSLALMLWLFISVANRYKRSPDLPPRGAQSLLEPIIIFIRDEIAKPSIGKHYERFLPFLLSIFFFIWINNLMGLIPVLPGGANVTGNITVTLVLALFTFFITTLNGNKYYWQEIFNAPGVPWWLKLPVPLMPVIEIVGMFTKPFVLMVRLFANITAGHIIVLGFFSLIFIFGEMQPAFGYGVSVLSIAFTIFMTMLELLVALIQAYVFTLLSALYFGMATAEHH